MGERENEREERCRKEGREARRERESAHARAPKRGHRSGTAAWSGMLGRNTGARCPPVAKPCTPCAHAPPAGHARPGKPATRAHRLPVRHAPCPATERTHPRRTVLPREAMRAHRDSKRARRARVLAGKRFCIVPSLQEHARRARFDARCASMPPAVKIYPAGACTARMFHRASLQEHARRACGARIAIALQEQCAASPRIPCPPPEREGAAYASRTPRDGSAGVSPRLALAACACGMRPEAGARRPRAPGVSPAQFLRAGPPRRAHDARGRNAVRGEAWSAHLKRDREHGRSKERCCRPHGVALGQVPQKSPRTSLGGAVGLGIELPLQSAYSIGFEYGDPPRAAALRRAGKWGALLQRRDTRAARCGACCDAGVDSPRRGRRAGAGPSGC